MNVVTIFFVTLFLILLGYSTYKAPRLTSIICWALMAAVLSSAALILLLPGPIRERLLWVGFAIPFLWVALQFLSYWDNKPWRVASFLIAISVVSSVVILVSEPVV